MKLKRDVSGLQRNAEQKRQATFDKVERGIQQLIKDKSTINFKTVAEASGVSKAWLYKQPDLKARIERLRGQTSQRQKTPFAVSASKASLKRLTQTLKGRIKKLESENTDLRRQNEVFGEYVLRSRELEKRIKQLEAENQKLKAETHETSTAYSSDIYAELEQLGVKPNSTLEKLISSTPGGIIETATQALRQAQSAGSIANPGGFLNKAITDCWQPNEEAKGGQDLAEFNEWWKWAYGEGIVVASMIQDGTHQVLLANEQWVSVLEAMETYPPNAS